MLISGPWWTMRPQVTKIFQTRLSGSLRLGFAPARSRTRRPVQENRASRPAPARAWARGPDRSGSGQAEPDSGRAVRGYAVFY